MRIQYKPEKIPNDGKHKKECKHLNFLLPVPRPIPDKGQMKKEQKEREEREVIAGHVFASERVGDFCSAAVFFWLPRREICSPAIAPFNLNFQNGENDTNDKNVCHEYGELSQGEQHRKK